MMSSSTKRKLDLSPPRSSSSDGSITHNSVNSNGAFTTDPRHESPGDEDPEADDPDETHEPARKRRLTPCGLGLNSPDAQKKTTKAGTTNEKGCKHEPPWPDDYAPDNPSCKNINSRYGKVIKRWATLGQNPQDLWDKEKGIMIRAIKMVKSNSNRLTQRTFKYTNELLSAMENEDKESQPKTTTNKKANRAHAGHQQETEPVENEPGNSTANTSPESQIDSADDALGPPKPKLGTPYSDRSAIEVGSNISVEDVLSSAVRETVRRLRSNEMLQSDDIERCISFLDRPDDWYVFDPGFPVNGKGHACRKPKPRHLVFFCHANTHWSLCYVDTAKAVLHHYNSSKGIAMPTAPVKDWVERQGGFKLDRAIEIKNEECPQQKGNVDCGIYALAVLKSLFAGTAVPENVDAASDRRDFASKVETAASKEVDNGVDATSTANPVTSDGQNRDSTTKVFARVPVESHLVTPEPPPDSTQRLLAQQALMGLSITSQTAGESPLDPQLACSQPPIVSPIGRSEAALTPETLQSPSRVDSAQAAMAFLISFMTELKTLQAEKKDRKKQLVAQRKTLTTMENNLSAQRKKLEQQEQRVKELESQVMRLEPAVNFNQSIRQSIGDHYDSQTDDLILQKWREKLTSTLDEMNDQSAALTKQKQDAQVARERHQEEIQCLEAKIIQGRARKKELEARIKTHNDTLAEVKRLCTKVANEDESPDEEEGVEE